MEEFYHKTGQHSLVNKNSGINLLNSSQPVNIFDIPLTGSIKEDDEVKDQSENGKKKTENDLINSNIVNNQNGNSSNNFKSKNSFDELNDLFSNTAIQSDNLKPIREVDKVGVIKELYHQTFAESKKEEQMTDKKQKVVEFINSPHQLPLLGVFTSGTGGIKLNQNEDTKTKTNSKKESLFEAFGGIDFNLGPRKNNSVDNLIDISIIGKPEQEEGIQFKNSSAKTLNTCLEKLHFKLSENVANIENDKKNNRHSYPTFDDVDLKTYSVNNMDKQKTQENICEQSKIKTTTIQNKDLDFFD